MARREIGRVACVVAVLVGGTVVSAPLTGCSGGGLGGLMSSPSAMELLSPLVRDAANSYVESLGALAASLGNVKDLDSALAFVKNLEPTVNQVSSAYQTLSGTTGEERSNLMKAFGPKIDATNRGFLGETEKVKGEGMLGRVVTPLLDKVKLFQ